MDAELIGKVVLALIIIALCWFYFSSDRSQRSLMLKKQNQTDQTLTKLKQELEASNATNKILLNKITEYRLEVEEVQEHCARLRKGQQRIASRLKYLCGMIDGISGKRRLQSPIEVSFIEREKAKVSPKVKASLKNLGDQLRNF